MIFEDAPNLPPLDPRRKKTLMRVLEYFHTSSKPDLDIVEVGVIRNDKILDGGSTRLWAWYLKEHVGSYWGCDVSMDAVEYAREVFKGMLNADVVHEDGYEFLRSRPHSSCDLLFLDGYDYWGFCEMESMLFHAKCAHEGVNIVRENGIILIDDVFDHKTYRGKGGIAIPYLLGMGWEIMAMDYMCALKRRKK